MHFEKFESLTAPRGNRVGTEIEGQNEGSRSNYKSDLIATICAVGMHGWQRLIVTFKTRMRKNVVCAPPPLFFQMFEMNS